MPFCLRSDASTRPASISALICLCKDPREFKPNGDWVIIEQRSYARNGEIVVALIEKSEATLKFIEQYPHETLLIPANSNMSVMKYRPEQVEIQGVLVGQMRSYINK
jgi:repressor LexA